MTNKKFKVAAMSLALTACVVAAPLAANAEAPDTADAQTPAAAEDAPQTAGPEEAVCPDTPSTPAAVPDPTASEPVVPPAEAIAILPAAPEERPVVIALPVEELPESEADKPAAEPVSPAPALPLESETASETQAPSNDALIDTLMPNESDLRAADGGVATIGNITYGTLDDAIDAAQDGDTILVNRDTESQGMVLDKSLTFKGNQTRLETDAAGTTTETSVKPKLTFRNGISLRWADLLFQGLDLDMTGIGSTPNEVDGQTWMGICLNGDATLTLDDTDLLMDGADIVSKDLSKDPQGIYLAGNGHNVLNVQNGSHLTIRDYYNAIKWNGIQENPNSSYNINITGGSSLTADHNEGGIVGLESLKILVEDSTLTVTNCTRRNGEEGRSGANGADFTIRRSTVDFSNNADAYGLYAHDLFLEDSTLTANNNGYVGIRISGKGQFLHSIITITNTLGKGNAALELVNVGNEAGTGRNIGSLEVKDSLLNISNNHATGIRCNTGTTLNISDDSTAAIQNNRADHEGSALLSKGGGLLVRSGASARLGRSTVLNNNHAGLAGDDIFVEPGGSLTFSRGNAIGGGDALDDCGDRIDGWYIDSEGRRWDFHGDQNFVQNLLSGETPLGDGVTLTDNGDGTYTITVSADSAGLALKAAHAELPAPEPDPEPTPDPKPVPDEPDVPVTPDEPAPQPVEDSTPETPPETPVVPVKAEIPPVQSLTPDTTRRLPQTGMSTRTALGMALSGLALTLAGAFTSLRAKKHS